MSTSFIETPSPLEPSGPILAAGELAEERLSLLGEFLESLPLVVASAARLITGALAAHGIDLGMDDAPVNPTDIEETSTKIGQCPAPAGAKPVDDAGEMGAVFQNEDEGEEVEDEGAIIPESDDEIALWRHYDEMDCDDIVSDIHALQGELKQLDPDLDPEDLELFKETRRAYRIALAVLKYKEDNHLC